MKNKFLVFFLMVGILSTSAQRSLNDYKYVVVPHSYDFLKGKNKYRLNTTTRFLLKKNGLDAYMEGELIESDYIGNKCLALRADVENLKAFLSTKLRVTLTNCDGTTIYESKIGYSKEKAFEDAYKEALMDAFQSFADLNYHYKPNENILERGDDTDTSVEDEASKEVERLKAEIEELKAETKNTQTTEANKKVDSEKFNVKEEFGPTKTNQRLKDSNPKKPTKSDTVVKEEKKIEEAADKVTETKEEVVKNVEEVVNNNEPVTEVKKPQSNMLYAQALDSGYQVVDSTPKIVMILLKTAQADFFIVKDQNAIVYKENGVWYYSKGDEKKQLNIKF